MLRSRLLLAAAVLPLAAAAPEPGSALVTLKPVTQAGAVTAIEVTLELNGRTPEDARLSAPIVYPGAPGVAERMTGITAADARGAVPMTTTDDPAVPGGFPYYRHWTPARAVSFPLRVRYRALVMAPGGAGGPAFGIRAVGGGLAGAGSTLLMTPDGKGYRATRLHWDLSALPAGSIASTSFGDGADVAVADGPGRLTGGWILAGPASRYPVKGSAEGFSAAWLGTPTFDAPAEMAWTARAHAYLAGFFPHLKPTPPYRVFMQFRDQAPFGGATALEQSFMLSRGPLKPGEARQAPRGTLFHEMIHQWVGGIDAPVGESSWFSEGLTTYYEHLLPMKGGFTTPDAYLAEVNELSEEYFTSKARNWSAAQITKVGFGDEEVRHTPYRRSAMYLFDLDARIRARSGGKRSLKTLLFPMFMAREKGDRFDTARWIAMVTGELGPDEGVRFRRLILEGAETLEPRADAFGPCFARQPASFSHDGRTVAGFTWTRVAGVPDAACRKR